MVDYCLKIASCRQRPPTVSKNHTLNHSRTLFCQVWRWDYKKFHPPAKDIVWKTYLLAGRSCWLVMMAKLLRTVLRLARTYKRGTRDWMFGSSTVLYITTLNTWTRLVLLCTTSSDSQMSISRLERWSFHKDANISFNIVVTWDPAFPL